MESCWKEGIPETTAITIGSLITEAGEAIGSAVGVTWDLMTANPLLCLFVGVSVVSLGFAFFRKAKRTAR